MAREIELESVTFHGGGRTGDFGWMRHQPRYADTLFIFNDNEPQFEAFQRGDRTAGCSPGSGNGQYRPWQCEDPPRAAGIPTGAASGYTELDAAARSVIDRAVAYVATVLETGRYDRVVYANKDGDPDVLGYGTFSPGLDVVRYIPAALQRMVASVNDGNANRPVEG